MRRRARLVLGLAALAVVLAACVQNASQDALSPKGEAAQKAHDLFVPVFWIAAAIFFIVEGILVLFLIRYRHRKGREGIPPQVHGNTRLEIAWTIVPFLIFAGVAVPTVTTIFDLSRRPAGDVLEVNVLGHQWWWEFDYPGLGITTANVLHIPVDEPVYLTLCGVGAGYEGAGVPSTCQPGGAKGPQPATVGDAVIHSFWVPELAGTQDVIPGRVNFLTLQADEPGVYSGQCKEFCGLAHADMRFRVVAHAQEDFDAWVHGQQQDAATPPAGSLAATGLEAFLGAGCVACHAIQGVEDASGNPLVANGGSNLTHFASRECFAGCILENTPENLARWLDDPPAIKPGSWMGDYGLTEEQIEALVAYLRSLT